MEMHDILAAVHEDAQPSVLATILCVEGHSYRKAGAAMLFRLTGEQIGTVSPGCLEHDLFERAANVWESGNFELIEYNMNADEDVIWGDAIGCGGKLKVLLEPVRGVLRSLLLKAFKQGQEGSAVRLERSWLDEKIIYELRTEERAKGNKWTADSELEDANQMSVLITPRPRLVLFGAGKDAETIYSLVKRIGFQIIIADWRSSLCKKELYPDAECVTGSPEQIMQQLQLNAEDYLIVSSHNLQQDREMIRLALPLQLVYIGVMGSKKRIRSLFETFLIPSNVRAPIGLSIGAEGPDEIAVSVAAELIAIRAGQKGRNGREATRDAYFSPLFGGGHEQKNGTAKASDRAGDGRISRQYGASCYTSRLS